MSLRWYGSNDLMMRLIPNSKLPFAQYSVPITKLLLEKNAVLDDDANKAGVTPLMAAGEQNHLAVAEFLIARGADVSHPEIHGYMPITRALFKGNTEIVRLYKRHGALCQVKIVNWYQRCLEIGD